VGVADDTAVVSRCDVENSTYLYGRIRPEEYEMKFGNTHLSVASVEVADGQQVKKGDVLIRLDTEGVQKDIDDLTKQLDDIKTQYGYDDADRLTDITAARIQQDDTVTGSALQLQELNIQRLELVDSQAKNAEADDIANRTQEINDLIQTMDQAELDADMDGIIADIRVAPGDYIQPFETGAVIADYGSIYVNYTGQASTMGLSSVKSITGSVGGAEYEMVYEPMPISEQVTYILKGLTPPSKFTFKDADAASKLTPGETVILRCVLNITENVLAVPVNAIYSNGPTDKYVYLETVDSAGNPVKTITPVKLGLSNECVTVITDGLNEGDVVYVKP